MTDIEVNQWHDRTRAAARSLQIRYGNPRTWFRRSLHLGNGTALTRDDYKFEDHINAAVVFHKDGQYQQGIEEAQWALIIRWPATPDLVTVVAVVEDPEAWLRAQIARGARAWYRYDDYRPYVWRMPEPEDIFAERPPAPGCRVNHDSVIEDYKNGVRVRDICERYSISRQTLMNIRAKYGLASPKHRAKEKAQD